MFFFFSRDFGRSTRSRWWKSAHWGQVFQTERGNFLQFRFLDGRTQHPKWSLDRSAVEQCRHSLFDLKALGESTKFFSGCTCPSLDECIRIRTNMTFVLKRLPSNKPFKIASTMFCLAPQQAAECKFVSLQRASKLQHLEGVSKKIAKKEEPCNRRLGVVWTSHSFLAFSAAWCLHCFNSFLKKNVSNQLRVFRESRVLKTPKGLKNNYTFSTRKREIPTPAPPQIRHTQNIGHQYQQVGLARKESTWGNCCSFLGYPLVALVFLEGFLLETSALLESGSESLAFEPRG